MRTASPLCCIVLAAASVAFAQKRAEVTTTFRQEANHYVGCKLIDRYKTEVKREGGTIQGMRLVFTDIKLPGHDVQVDAAELQMTFREEAWSRIRNAKLELFDAADDGGKPVCVVEYKDGKIVGMDPATRVVTWPVPAAIVRRWMKNPGSNKGLRFHVIPERDARFQFVFHMPAAKEARKRPALAVDYSFTGEAPPVLPELTTHVAGKTFGPTFTVAWHKKRWGPNGTPVAYEIAVGGADGDFRTVGRTPAEALRTEVATAALAVGKPYQLRLRAVDPTGLASDWVTTEGEFRVSRDSYVVWTQDAVTKVQREENPPGAMVPVALAAARNEYESFQVVVSGLSNLTDVDVVTQDLRGPMGMTIPADNLHLYRVHYVDCKGDGWLPDSMVPWTDPWDSKRIGGPYGAPFAVESGTNAIVWVEIYVPEDAMPGDYQSSLEVTLGGKTIATVPVTLTVWPVTLPKTTTLLTYMELSRDTAKRHTLHELHRHRMDVWYIPYVGHGLAWQDGQPVVKWNAEYDKLLDDYFSGRLFQDGLPGKSYLHTAQSWKIHRVMQGDSDKNRIAVLKQYEEHYKHKPWVKQTAWFFIDEPNKKTLAKCLRVAKQIKGYSPSIPFLLTTRYNPDLVGLVDIWDAIINAEVINWDAPGPDVYRNEMQQGRRAINCITVNSNTPTSPNLFIHHRAMNTRIWTWATFCLDQQGIEFWRVNAAPDVTTPKKFGAAVWGDGSLFYRGLPVQLGIHEEISLPSIRLKILRDGIEDSELLSMLKRKDADLAKSLSRLMVQETKDYDGSFSQPVQHTSWNWNRDGKGDRRVPGYIIWESDPARLAVARAAIAKALAD